MCASRRTTAGSASAGEAISGPSAVSDSMASRTTSARAAV
jgi:hypothetical protein